MRSHFADSDQKPRIGAPRASGGAPCCHPSGPDLSCQVASFFLCSLVPSKARKPFCSDNFGFLLSETTSKLPQRLVLTFPIQHLHPPADGYAELAVYGQPAPGNPHAPA